MTITAARPPASSVFNIPLEFIQRRRYRVRPAAAPLKLANNATAVVDFNLFHNRFAHAEYLHSSAQCPACRGVMSGGVVRHLFSVDIARRLLSLIFDT